MITQKKTSVADPYDELAAQFSVLSDGRSAYLRTVDRLILHHAPEQVDAYLDIGSGDGQRGFRLGQALRAKQVHLLEPNRSMFNLQDALPQLPDVVRHNTSPLKHCPSLRFDVITCLWNVFGHILPSDERLQTLSLIRSWLKPDGIFLADINNRLNISHYGLTSVLKNIIRDLFKDEAGLFALPCGEGAYSVYLHSPAEFDSLCTQAGFMIVKKYYVDYDTGRRRSHQWMGQILYLLGANR